MTGKKLIDALSLTHHRNHEATWFDADLWQSTWSEVGWEAQYAWVRMLSGPEYVRHGFPIDQLQAALDAREFDTAGAVESLIRNGFITERDGYYGFPNVVWGTPPEEGVR